MRTGKHSQKLTVLTLAVALAVAVYLNWEYARTGDIAAEPDAAQTSATAEDAVVVDALPVAEQTAASEESATGDKNYGEAQLVSVTEGTGTEFFEQARLSRTKSRDEALDTLQKSLKSAKLTDEEKENLTAQLSSQIDSIAAENEIETLLKAKGFVDCVVFIGEDKVDVTVMTTNAQLGQSEVAQIRDAVLERCEVAAQDITVVEVR